MSPHGHEEHHVTVTDYVIEVQVLLLKTWQVHNPVAGVGVCWGAQHDAAHGMGHSTRHSRQDAAVSCDDAPTTASVEQTNASVKGTAATNSSTTSAPLLTTSPCCHKSCIAPPPHIVLFSTVPYSLCEACAWVHNLYAHGVPQPVIWPEQLFVLQGGEERRGMWKSSRGHAPTGQDKRVSS